tara:strand:- start:19072 stop:19683 length:612 start_codon:yes stop_codon:yes gene_type:complete
MNRVLVLCPDEFRSASKLARKLDVLLQNLDKVQLLTLDAATAPLQGYADERGLTLESLAAANLEECLEGLTHAVVFDDGEVFPQQLVMLREAGIAVRRIRIAITRVVNIKRDTDWGGMKSTATYEYIGRGSYWGNPYSMYEEGEDRDEVIRKYQYDFDYEKFPNKDKARVYELAGKRLGCFCKPQSCHGDVLADYLNAWDDGE